MLSTRGMVLAKPSRTPLVCLLTSLVLAYPRNVFSDITEHNCVPSTAMVYLKYHSFGTWPKFCGGNYVRLRSDGEVEEAPR